VDGWIALLVIAGSLLWMSQVNPYEKEQKRLILASGIMCAGCAPLLYWMRSFRRSGLPIFQLHCLFYGICFGFVGFYPDESTLVQFIEEASMQKAQWVTLIALASTVTAFFAGRWLMRGLRPLRSPLEIPASSVGTMALVAPMLLGVDLIVEFLKIPYLDQIFTTCWNFVFFFLSAGWISGKLRGYGLWVYLALLLPLTLLRGVAAGQIAEFMLVILVLGILMLTIKRRVFWGGLIGCCLVFILLQPAKGYFRSVYWHEQREGGMLKRVQSFARFGFESIGGKEGGDFYDFQKSIEVSVIRINQLHPLGAVIRDTPSVKPYEEGVTYLPLVTKWIPRALWPDKPKEDLGHQWAQRYGFLGTSDYTTSFNLPWLTEMYINFGWKGVVGINLLIGILFALAHRLYFDRPNGLAGMACALTIGIHIIFVESHMSLLLGEFTIALILLYGFKWLFVLFAEQRKG